MPSFPCPFCNALVPVPPAGDKVQCPLCGEPIPEERLAAVPYATLCVADRRLLERP